MAKLPKGIFGPVSGTIGSVVGSTWKNIAYLRQRPRKAKKKKPRTAAQIANEMKFKFIQQWLVPFYPYITVGFKKFASNKTEINAAFSFNYKQAFSGVWPNITVNYANVTLSRGRLAGLYHPEVQRNGSHTLELTWEINPHPYTATNDQLMLILYCPELELADGFIGGVKRNALACSFDFDQRMANKNIEVYLSVTSLSRNKVADSIYLGRI